MHDLDRQQLEQHEREGLAGLPELAQPESYARVWRDGNEALPLRSYGAAPPKRPLVRHGADIVLLGA